MIWYNAGLQSYKVEKIFSSRIAAYEKRVQTLDICAFFRHAYRKMCPHSGHIGISTAFPLSLIGQTYYTVTEIPVLRQCPAGR